MEIEIRPAKKDDSGPITECMYSAAPELYDFVFGTTKVSAQEFIRYEYLSGLGFCGYRNATVAVAGDRVVGTGCFYGGADHPGLMRASLMNILKFYRIPGAFRVYAHARHIGSVMTPPRRNELYLSNFGVSPDFRSKGVGSQMIEHQLATCGARGFKTFALDVAANNPKAQRLYETLGLSVTEEKVFSAKGAGVPNTRKMERVL